MHVLSTVDFDGFQLLIERDYREFTEFEENSKKRSLEELKENHNYWRNKMKDATEKYGFSNEKEGDSNISLFMARLTYFYYLAMFGWKSLRAYTEKLAEENQKLKKSKKKIITRKRVKKKCRDIVSVPIAFCRCIIIESSKRYPHPLWDVTPSGPLHLF